MTSNEIIKLLKKAGYEIIAGAKHDKAIHKESGKMIAIPRHKGDVPKGTAHNILKEAGIKQGSGGKNEIYIACYF